jgi:hypothetical protein
MRPRIRVMVLAAALVANAPTVLAYRTASDSPEFAGAGRVRWADDRIPYRLHQAVPRNLYLDAVEREVQHALTRWSEPSCSGVSFSYQGVTYVRAAPGDGENTIDWLSDGWDARGFASDAAAITDVIYAKGVDGQWRIIEADMYVNADGFVWVLSGAASEGYRDVSSVLTHEGGHMLGLLHPCELGGGGGAPDCAGERLPASITMYPLYDARQAQLSDDDIAGACFLYPRPACDDLSCASGSGCIEGRCVELCQGRVCGADEVCSANGCQSAASDHPHEGTCASAVECTAGHTCKDGVCVSNFAFAGDPCSSDADCPDGACVDAGYCAPACTDGSECPAGSVCDVLGDGARACVSGGLPLGALCSAPNQCVGGECLDGDAEHAVCTRACSNEDAACPGRWFCDTVDGHAVCRPPVQLGGACALSRSSGSFSSLELLASWSLVLGAASLVRRRRARLRFGRQS